MADAESTENAAAPSASSPPPRVPTLGVRTGGVEKPSPAKGWDESGFRGYMEAKNRKLRGQFHAQFGEDGRGLFAGVVVWVDGVTEPNRNEIREIVGENGGKLETYFGSSVTHVVAEVLATATRARLGKPVGKGKVRVVRPRWIVRSLEEGKLLPEVEFSVKGMRDPTQKSIASMFGKPKASKAAGTASKGSAKKS